MARLKIRHPKNISKKAEEAAALNALAQSAPSPMAMETQAPALSMSQAPSPDMMAQAPMAGMKEGGMSSVSDYIKDLIK
jgi:hypothetical protein